MGLRLWRAAQERLRDRVVEDDLVRDPDALFAPTREALWPAVAARRGFAGVAV
ncbi:MAG: hypothetical protein NTV17_08645 [Burkholderiales bacterium]|nr:hypothetical protein [Burkholderiales bacterium]